MASSKTVSLDAITKTAELELIKLLDALPGDKVLVLDDQIVGPIGLIASSTTLKEHGVKKIFKLNNKDIDVDIRNILYIVRPRIQLMKFIAGQIKYLTREAEKRKGKPDEDSRPKNFHIAMVPRRTLICEKVLEEVGVYGDVKISEYALDLIPYDDDLMSMELPFAFKECQLDGDMSSLYYVARSIMKIQSFYGLISNIKVKGDNAKSVFDMMLRMRKQVGSEVFQNVTPEIDTLILIDRKVDMITPMLTQFTYEGLLDELFGIKNGLFQPDFPCVPDVKSGNPKVVLKSTDTVFAKIRDLNQQFVGSQLKVKAKEVEEQMNRRNKLDTIKEIKEFTKVLPQLQEDKRNLEMHINIFQEVQSRISKMGFKDFVSSQIGVLEGEDEDIEKYISKQEPLVKVLRLLCLMSLTRGGLARKKYDFYRTEIIQSYGFEALLTLKNLEKLGLFCCSDDNKYPFNFNSVKKALNLYNPKIMEDRDASFKDIHSVYNGTSPLSVALIEGMLQSADSTKWGPIEDVLNMLPGAQKTVTQRGADDTHTQKKVVLVYFIGGVTFAEISALRYLSERRFNDKDYEFIICSTKMINGNTFLDSLIEDVGTPFKKRAMHGLSLFDDPPKNDDNDQASPLSQEQDQAPARK